MEDDDKSVNGPTGAPSNELLITIFGQGIDIKRNVPLTALPSLLSIVTGVGLGSHQAVSSTAKHADEKDEAEEISPRTSLREFLNEVEPSTNVETIATIAFYLWKVRGLEKFSTDDIKKGFKEAREPLPGNISRDIGKAVVAGWIANGDHSREYFLTNSGEKAVKSKFVE